MFTNDSIIFVDADSLLFKICYSTKNTKEIRTGIKYAIKNIKKECGSDNLLLAVKGTGNFRKELYPAYKAHRKPLEEDIREALRYAYEFVHHDLHAIRADGMEADDLVSIWSAEARDMGREHVVAGIDKDLLQIPGHHYNYNKRTHQQVAVDAANLNLMRQCISGDAGDNIPGVKGIGPVKATKLLDGIPMHRRWNRVRAVWKQREAGNPFLSRDLLRMLTSWEELEAMGERINEATSNRHTNSVDRDKRIR